MSSLRDRLNRLKGRAGGGGERQSPANAPKLAVGESPLAWPETAQLAEGESPQAWPGLPQQAQPAALPQQAAALEERLAHGSLTICDAGPEWGKLDVHMAAGPYGSFLRRIITYPLTYRFGSYVFGDLCDLAKNLHWLSDGNADVSYDKLLFLDTETTGLGIGAGNVPFMIGLGYVQAGHFCVEQLMIRHPGEGAAMLHYLQELLSGFEYLATYNGRTFDWPILANRFVMSRIRLADVRFKHLDFLYPSRSLWRNTLESCRLSKVEESRLGILRENDVPGSLAPVLYFQYLSEGNPDILKGVIEHNEHDIMSLAVLAVHLGLAADGRLDSEAMDNEEAYRLALWLDKIGNADVSRLTADTLAARGNGRLREHLLQLGQYYKKKGALDRSVMFWRAYIELKEGSVLASAEPYIELAMYYEHKSRQFDIALEYARMAADLLSRKKAVARADAGKLRNELAQLNKRIERLSRKSGASLPG